MVLLNLDHQIFSCCCFAVICSFRQPADVERRCRCHDGHQFWTDERPGSVSVVCRVVLLRRCIMHAVDRTGRRVREALVKYLRWRTGRRLAVATTRRQDEEVLMIWELALASTHLHYTPTETRRGLYIKYVASLPSRALNKPKTPSAQHTAFNRYNDITVKHL